MLVATSTQGESMTSRRTLTVAGAALAATAFAACSSADTGRATPTRAQVGSAQEHATPTTSRVAAARQAVRTARRAAGYGRPYDIERDRHRGARVWEVKVASGTARPYEILVSRNGRKVIGRHRDDHRSDDARKAQRAKIGLSRALRIAGRHGSGAFTDAEIDRHRGRLVWTATFERGRTETEVALDASTGRVVDVRRDTDDD
jgi:uncharacterized membrane protein YkoI